MVLLLELERDLVTDVRVEERRGVDGVAVRITDNDGVGDRRSRSSAHAVGAASRGSADRRGGSLSLELRTDGEGLSLECTELGTRVRGEDHTHTAMAGSKASVLRAVNPDGVFLRTMLFSLSRWG